MTTLAINIHDQKPFCDLSVEMLLLNQERDALTTIALELSRSTSKAFSYGIFGGLNVNAGTDAHSKHTTSTLEYVEALSRLDTTLRLGDAKAIVQHVTSAIHAFELSDIYSWGDIATKERRDSIKASVLKTLGQIDNKMMYFGRLLSVPKHELDEDTIK
jgi:hypothetical protein